METLNVLTKCYRALNAENHNNPIMADILFCSHHPALSKGQKKSYKIWTQSLNVSVGDDGNANFLAYNGIAELICRSDRHGIFSTTTMERAASKRLLSTMTKYGNGETSTFIKMNVIPLICDKLSSTNNIFINLTSKEIDIFIYDFEIINTKLMNMFYGTDDVYVYELLDTYKKKIYVYGIALTSEEKDLVISEATEILDVENVVASILLVEDLRIQKE